LLNSNLTPPFANSGARIVAGLAVDHAVDLVVIAEVAIAAASAHAVN
jgi:hypothetical protein